MDKKEFVKIMRKLRVPIELYNIDGKGRKDERFCLTLDGECIILREDARPQISTLILKVKH